MGKGKAVDHYDEFYRSLGAKVAEARTMRGISQADLADAIGLVRSSVANIEAGRQRILAHTLVEIASAVAMPVEWLAWVSKAERESWNA